MSKIFYVLLIVGAINFASCGGGNKFLFLGKKFTDLDSFALIAQSDSSESSEVYQTYSLNEFRPVWCDKNGIKPIAKQLYDQILSLEKEGITFSDSLGAELQQCIERMQNVESVDAATAYKWDKLLTYSFHTAAKAMLMGSTPEPKKEQWFVSNDSVYYGHEFLVHSLRDSISLFDTFRPTIREYQAILQEMEFWEEARQDSVYMAAKKDASNTESIRIILAKECRYKSLANDSSKDQSLDEIKIFQSYYGIPVSGKLDAATKKVLSKTPDEYIKILHLNLDRLRRLPRDLGDHYVWVNIPLMELDYYRDAQNKFHARVIVGQPGRPTPSISAPMTQIVFNPAWGVPPTIFKKDVVPGVSRSGGAYLAKKGMRAYDSRGRDVTAQVNASNIHKFFISQPPGANNALGDIKFNMPNSEAIYIHDTPNRGLFKQKNRALSSGCVRTENPRRLAEIILNSDSFRMVKIESIINTRKTKIQNLEQQIPVYII